MIREELESIADSAEPIKTDRPAQAVEPFKAFPVDVLPEPLRGFVSVGAESIGCDVAYIALPLLTATASVVGNARRIQLKSG